MTAFFAADTHFGDRRTIHIHQRPFASVAEMDAELIVYGADERIEQAVDQGN